MERRSTASRAARWSPLGLAVIALGVGLIALAAYLGAFYQPLAGVGPSDAEAASLDVVSLEAAPGSEGKPTWMVSRVDAGTAVVRFELRNAAPFPVTVTGVENPSEHEGYTRRELVVADGGAWRRVERLRVGARATRAVGLRFVVPAADVCTPGMMGGHTYSEHLQLRFRYLGVYRRSEAVPLPFVWDVACEDELPPPYDWR